MNIFGGGFMWGCLFASFGLGFELLWLRGLQGPERLETSVGRLVQYLSILGRDPGGIDCLGILSFNCLWMLSVVIYRVFPLTF